MSLSQQFVTLNSFSIQCSNKKTQLCSTFHTLMFKELEFINEMSVARETTQKSAFAQKNKFLSASQLICETAIHIWQMVST